MKRNDVLAIVVVAIVTGTIAFIIAGILFNSPSKRKDKAPVVQPISSTLPDIKNDPAYQAFLYPGALDPTQPIRISGSNNTAPFTQ